MSNQPYILAEHVRVEGVLDAAFLVVPDTVSNAAPHPVNRVGDGGRVRVQIQHGHDHVPLPKRLPINLEPAAGGETARAAIPERISLFTWKHNDKESMTTH